ncbi:MAG: DUF2306 domain-containing protein [Spirosomataceae bacterium]
MKNQKQPKVVHIGAEIGAGLVMGIITVFALIMLTKIIPYFPSYQPIDFLTTKTDQILSQVPFKWAFYIHIVSSWVVMVVGLGQFLPTIAKHKPTLHRLLGKLYIVFIIGLAAPSGLVLAQYANGGLPAKVGFSMQCFVWWYITISAWQAIKHQKWQKHIDQMIRSYAVTLAAMSLRVGSYMMIYYLGTKPIETYLTVTWLSWTLNLLIAEIIIQIGLSQWLLKIVHFKSVK